jgi:hypothetical protein
MLAFERSGIMGVAVSITRLDLTASELRKAASGEKSSAAARGILALALVLDGVDRKTAAETCGWTVRRCGTGCTVTTRRDWPDFAISNRRVPAQNSWSGSRPNWPGLSRLGPDPAVHTGSCVGGGTICMTNWSGASVSRSTSVRLGRFSPGSATANFR